MVVFSGGYLFPDASTNANGDEIKKIERCGVIPYTIINGELHFLMSQNFKYREYGDFGGGVKADDRNIIDSAVREFFEESLGIFDAKFYRPETYQRALIYMSRKMAIIFHYVDPVILIEAPSIFEKRFLARQREGLNSEVCSIKLISEKFLDLLLASRRTGNGEIWVRVRNFLNENLTMMNRALLKIYSINS